MKTLVSCIISKGTRSLTHNILLLLCMKTVGANHSSAGITALLYCLTWLRTKQQNKLCWFSRGNNHLQITLLNVSVCSAVFLYQGPTSEGTSVWTLFIPLKTGGKKTKKQQASGCNTLFSAKPQPLFKKLANVFQIWATHEKACWVPPGYVGCAWLPGQECFSVNHCSSKVKLHWHHRENAKNVY